MIVSLEVIFLSTFVMITQNRQEDARRLLADQEWEWCDPRSGTTKR
jgi:uncharacterized membrane protein